MFQIFLFRLTNNLFTVCMGLVLLKHCRISVEPSDITFLSKKRRRMTCESCGIRFSLLKRKKKCHECWKDFCSACLIKEIGPRNLFCHTCRILTEVPVDRSELMKLRAKDLQHFLFSKDIPTNSCREKKELVDLIIAREALSRRPQTGFVQQNRNFTPSTNVQNMEAMERNPSNSGQNSNNTSAANNVSESEKASFPEKHAAESNSACKSESMIKTFVDEDIDNLSVRQLKEILSKNFVTYRGCCEKSELIKLAKRLQKEIKDNQKRVNMGLPEENLCKICMDAVVDCVLLDCGHMLSCTDCGKLLNECPVCRSFVVRVVRTFKA